MANESRSVESTTTTAVAIDKDKNSQFAVRWAIENLPKKTSTIYLVHVRTSTSPLQSQEIVPKEGRPPTVHESQQFFLPYRGFCARKGVRPKEVIIQDTDVPSALVEFIDRYGITQIVVGVSNRSALTRAFKNPDVPSTLGKCAPDFCAVYAISRGKVQNIRQSSRAPTSRHPSQSGYLSDNSSNSDEFSRTLSQGSWRSSGSEGISFERSSASRSYDRVSFDKSSDFTPMYPPYDKVQANNKKALLVQSATNNLRKAIQNQDSSSGESDFSNTQYSFQSELSSFDNIENSRNSDGSIRSSMSSHGLEELEDEMRRLKLELKQTMDMYTSACKETLNERQKAKEINQWKSTEARKLEEAKHSEEAALAMVELEKQKAKSAMEAAQMAQRLVELESQKRKNAEIRAKHESEERKKAVEALARSEIRYRKYSIEDIEVATNYFTATGKIGEGGYGPVYRAVLDHTPVAIKVLRPDISQGQKQFQQEVEVLSCMRHPHMVLLVGACPEYGCLVYEYMENGSLEDRLMRRGNSPTIPWRIRFKISAEIATALLFLHQAKPEPLVHRDLKPANILIDRNYVSKISDVGLARLVPPSVADSVTQYHMTAAAGTFCYIDPEYQQTGMLGTKSDVYSLGVMLLQIITAKPPMGLTHQVSRSIEKGAFSEILDQTVTDWPIEETLSFAKLALQCCELRRKDRPDLSTTILPELIRLRDFGLGNGAQYGVYGGSPSSSSSISQPR